MPKVTPKIPSGLEELMLNLAKSIIKENPPNLYEFAAEYFEKLLRERDEKVDVSYTNLPTYRAYRNVRSATKSLENDSKVDQTQKSSKMREKSGKLNPTVANFLQEQIYVQGNKIVMGHSPRLISRLRQSKNESKESIKDEKGQESGATDTNDSGYETSSLKKSQQDLTKQDIERISDVKSQLYTESDPIISDKGRFEQKSSNKSNSELKESSLVSDLEDGPKMEVKRNSEGIFDTNQSPLVLHLNTDFNLETSFEETNSNLKDINHIPPSLSSIADYESNSLKKLHFESGNSLDSSATKIQSLYRGYRIRRDLKSELDFECSTVDVEYLNRESTKADHDSVENVIDTNESDGNGYNKEIESYENSEKEMNDKIESDVNAKNNDFGDENMDSEKISNVTINYGIASEEISENFNTNLESNDSNIGSIDFQENFKSIDGNIARQSRNNSKEIIKDEKSQESEITDTNDSGYETSSLKKSQQDLMKQDIEPVLNVKSELYTNSELNNDIECSTVDVEYLNRESTKGDRERLENVIDTNENGGNGSGQVNEAYENNEKEMNDKIESDVKAENYDCGDENMDSEKVRNLTMNDGIASEEISEHFNTNLESNDSNRESIDLHENLESLEENIEKFIHENNILYNFNNHGERNEELNMDTQEIGKGSMKSNVYNLEKSKNMDANIKILNDKNEDLFDDLEKIIKENGAESKNIDQNPTINNKLNNTISKDLDTAAESNFDITAVEISGVTATTNNTNELDELSASHYENQDICALLDSHPTESSIIHTIKAEIHEKLDETNSIMEETQKDKHIEVPKEIEIVNEKFEELQAIGNMRPGENFLKISSDSNKNIETTEKAKRVVYRLKQDGKEIADNFDEIVEIEVLSDFQKGHMELKTESDEIKSTLPENFEEIETKNNIEGESPEIISLKPSEKSLEKCTMSLENSKLSVCNEDLDPIDASIDNSNKCSRDKNLLTTDISFDDQNSHLEQDEPHTNSNVSVEVSATFDKNDSDSHKVSIAQDRNAQLSVEAVSTTNEIVFHNNQLTTPQNLDISFSQSDSKSGTSDLFSKPVDFLPPVTKSFEAEFENPEKESIENIVLNPHIPENLSNETVENIYKINLLESSANSPPFSFGINQDSAQIDGIFGKDGEISSNFELNSDFLERIDEMSEENIESESKDPNVMANKDPSEFEGHKDEKNKSSDNVLEKLSDFGDKLGQKLTKLGKDFDDTISKAAKSPEKNKISQKCDDFKELKEPKSIESNESENQTIIKNILNEDINSRATTAEATNPLADNTLDKIEETNESVKFEGNSEITFINVDNLINDNYEVMDEEVITIDRSENLPNTLNDFENNKNIFKDQNLQVYSTEAKSKRGVSVEEIFEPNHKSLDESTKELVKNSMISNQENIDGNSADSVMGLITADLDEKDSEQVSKEKVKIKPDYSCSRQENTTKEHENFKNTLEIPLSSVLSVIEQSTEFYEAINDEELESGQFKTYEILRITSKPDQLEDIDEILAENEIETVNNKNINISTKCRRESTEGVINADVSIHKLDHEPDESTKTIQPENPMPDEFPEQFTQMTDLSEINEIEMICTDKVDINTELCQLSHSHLEDNFEIEEHFLENQSENSTARNDNSVKQGIDISTLNIENSIETMSKCLNLSEATIKSTKENEIVSSNEQSHSGEKNEIKSDSEAENSILLLQSIDSFPRQSPFHEAISFVADIELIQENANFLEGLNTEENLAYNKSVIKHETVEEKSHKFDDVEYANGGEKLENEGENMENVVWNENQVNDMSMEEKCEGYGSIKEKYCEEQCLLADEIMAEGKIAEQNEEDVNLRSKRSILKKSEKIQENLITLSENYIDFEGMDQVDADNSIKRLESARKLDKSFINNNGLSEKSMEKLYNFSREDAENQYYASVSEQVTQPTAENVSEIDEVNEIIREEDSNNENLESSSSSNSKIDTNDFDYEILPSPPSESPDEEEKTPKGKIFDQYLNIYIDELEHFEYFSNDPDGLMKKSPKILKNLNEIGENEDQVENFKVMDEKSKQIIADGEKFDDKNQSTGETSRNPKKEVENTPNKETVEDSDEYSDENLGMKYQKLNSPQNTEESTMTSFASENSSEFSEQSTEMKNFTNSDQINAIKGEEITKKMPDESSQLKAYSEKITDLKKNDEKPSAKELKDPEVEKSKNESFELGENTDETKVINKTEEMILTHLNPFGSSSENVVQSENVESKANEENQRAQQTFSAGTSTDGKNDTSQSTSNAPESRSNSNERNFQHSEIKYKKFLNSENSEDSAIMTKSFDSEESSDENHYESDSESSDNEENSVKFVENSIENCEKSVNNLEKFIDDPEKFETLPTEVYEEKNSKEISSIDPKRLSNLGRQCSVEEETCVEKIISYCGPNIDENGRLDENEEKKFDCSSLKSVENPQEEALSREENSLVEKPLDSSKPEISGSLAIEHRLESEQAAIKIQSIYRGYKVRQLYNIEPQNTDQSKKEKLKSIEGVNIDSLYETINNSVDVLKTTMNSSENKTKNERQPQEYRDIKLNIENSSRTYESPSILSPNIDDENVVRRQSYIDDVIRSIEGSDVIDTGLMVYNDLLENSKGGEDKQKDNTENNDEQSTIDLDVMGSDSSDLFIKQTEKGLEAANNINEKIEANEYSLLKGKSNTEIDSFQFDDENYKVETDDKQYIKSDSKDCENIKIINEEEESKSSELESRSENIPSIPPTTPENMQKNEYSALEFPEIIEIKENLTDKNLQFLEEPFDCLNKVNIFSSIDKDIKIILEAPNSDTSHMEYKLSPSNSTNFLNIANEIDGFSDDSLENYSMSRKYSNDSNEHIEYGKEAPKNFDKSTNIHEDTKSEQPDAKDLSPEQTLDSKIIPQAATLIRNDSLIQPKIIPVAKIQPQSHTLVVQPQEKNESGNVSIQRLSHSSRVSSRYSKLAILRQKTMPVQIESNVMRMMPKHIRKRIKSAESDKKKSATKP